MSKENAKIVKISTEYITLGQFLKFADVITNGGEAKQFIMTNKIFVNNELTTQRGKKLRDKDIVNINNSLFFEISK